MPGRKLKKIALGLIRRRTIKKARDPDAIVALRRPENPGINSTPFARTPPIVPFDRTVRPNLPMATAAIARGVPDPFLSLQGAPACANVDGIIATPQLGARHS